MRTRTALAVVILALFCAAPLFADVVHLKNGRTLEGEILSEAGTKVLLKTRFGEVTIEKADIASIDRRPTPLAEYESRRKALATDDAEGHYELALFCREKGLRSKEKELYEIVLRLDDQHPGANEAVGNVEYGGRWMTPAECDRLAASDADAEMRARGLVKHGGEWVTPEDKEKLDQGLVKYDGKWMTPDEVQIAKGFVKYKGGWVKRDELDRIRLKDTYGEAMKIEVNVVLTEHFGVVGPYTEAELQTIADGAEQVYSQFAAIFGIDSRTNLLQGAEEDAGRARCHVVYAKKALDYSPLVDFLVKRYPFDIPESRAKLIKAQKGYYHVYPGSYIIGYQFPNTFEQVVASVVHKASHALLMRYKYSSSFFPWWLIEGLGTYQEIAALGHCDTYCITDTGYGAPERSPDQKWAGLSRWKELVKGQVVGLSDTGLIRLSQMGLNELNFKDLAKCWSLCEWMIGKDKKTFVKFVDLLKQGQPLVKATQGAFGMSPEQLDREWQSYVRSNY